ncbi:T9SS type A sorting domain-containing protein [Pseudoflavitalea sp. X16]|uniref:T9SS type A sorting domain-containing protein n=1 Tax=Paraflavitalea devenefica TaxID=2716334 RepID=UPI0014212796|nr:T9SS type A sorting domain-containing protein [Paraflavitalea devenefica]NII28924.1 T9SS type A sorting domain-containing protein [Paraflavitalea devenefica]
MNPLVPNRKQIIVSTVSVAFPDYFLRRRVLITLLLLTAFYLRINAQAVSEVITDYNGYWKSRQNSISPVKPDNSHNMLAFTFNGTRYSTGVNDALLTSRGDVFVPGDYRALQVYSIANPTNANTKIGLGALYDGVHNGPSNPRPSNNIAQYLTDGINGLNLGTGIANLPAGEIMFALTGLQSQFIGDGIPDLLVTQIADPSSSADSYEFTDANGNRIGNKVDVVINTVPRVGVWVADFYDVNTNPMALIAGFTQTERNIRIWGADFSAFGINSSNVHDVVYFRIRISGDSDVAFVAYNNQAVSVGGLLPYYNQPGRTNNPSEPTTKTQAYPNPFTNKLILKHQPATGEEQYTLYNIQGVALLQHRPVKGSVQSTFDTQQLPADTYVLVLSNGKEQHTELLVKK